MKDNPLIIIGASARAAAFSASRAGYTPYWLDQFGDEDLRRRFRGQVISDYPREAVDLMQRAPAAAPFIFTGALENHDAVLQRLSAQRTLLGNAQPVCLKVRDPSRLHRVLRHYGLACPAIRMSGSGTAPSGDWLVKPLRSAGGIGMERYTEQPVDRHHYLQERIPGDSFSAVFIGGWKDCRLLGVTRQLVGLPEFHAGEFSYCGSIGPVELSVAEYSQWRRLGEVIGKEFQLTGLFGVDAIKHRGRIYPVEVNPRYTASVEVLELALGCHAVQFHCNACHNRAIDIGERSPRRLLGKAYLFAPVQLTFKGLPRTGGETEWDSIADIPAPGAEIKKNRPILTVFVSGDSISSIRSGLRRAAGRIFDCLVRPS